MCVMCTKSEKKFPTPSGPGSKGFMPFLGRGVRAPKKCQKVMSGQGGGAVFFAILWGWRPKMHHFSTKILPDKIF